MTDNKPEVALHVEDSRALFEEWARTHNYILSRFEASGDYQYATTACAWQAWQAAHTVQVPPLQTDQDDAYISWLRREVYRLSAQPLVRSPVMHGDDFDNLVETEAGNYGEMLEDGGPYNGWSFSCEALIEFSRAIINGWGMHIHNGDVDNLVETEAGNHGDMLEDGGPYSGWSFSCEALIEFSRAIIKGWEVHSHKQDPAVSEQPVPSAQGDSRLSFEAWAQSHGFDVTKDRGIYNTLETRSAWEAWLHWQRLSDCSPVTQDPNPNIAVIHQAMEHFPENSWMRGALDHAAAELAVLHSRHQNSALAARQPVANPIYQLQKADGSWIDQSKHSYDYNVAQGHSADLRVVYTAPPAQAVVPEGYVLSLIPKEDTAAFNAACTAAHEESKAGTGPCGVFIAGYRHIRANAPAVPTQAVDLEPFRELAYRIQKEGEDSNDAHTEADHRYFTRELLALIDKKEAGST